MTFAIRLKKFFTSRLKRVFFRFKRDGDLFKGKFFVNKC